MKNKSYILLYIALLLLIVNPKISTIGAKNGLLLWFNTIIPTLFPFIIISNMLAKLYGKCIKKPVLFPVFLGLVCGFPICGVLVSELRKENVLTLSQAQFALNCGNVASPMFVTAYAIGNYFSENTFIPILIVYISLALHILAMYIWYHPESQNIQQVTLPAYSKRDLLIMFDTSLQNACQTILKIGGYIIVFSMLAYIILQLPIDNCYLKAILMGSFEMTNAINYIHNLDINYFHRVLLITGIINWGGLCTIAQTNCVLSQKAASLKKYIIAKLFLTAITFCIACTILRIAGF